MDKMSDMMLQATKVVSLKKVVYKLSMTKVDRTECVSTNGGKVKAVLDIKNTAC